MNDRFHLGSDTKAITALLAAMMVEENKLNWTSTVADVFPEMAEKLAADFKQVTLQQFLSHTSGIPSDNDDFRKLLEKVALEDSNLDEMRRWLIQQASMKPLAAKPSAKIRLCQPELCHCWSDGKTGRR